MQEPRKPFFATNSEEADIRDTRLSFDNFRVFFDMDDKVEHHHHHQHQHQHYYQHHAAGLADHENHEGHGEKQQEQQEQEQQERPDNKQRRAGGINRTRTAPPALEVVEPADAAATVKSSPRAAKMAAGQKRRKEPSALTTPRTRANSNNAMPRKKNLDKKQLKSEKERERRAAFKKLFEDLSVALGLRQPGERMVNLDQCTVMEAAIGCLRRPVPGQAQQSAATSAPRARRYASSTPPTSAEPYSPDIPEPQTRAPGHHKVSHPEADTMPPPRPVPVTCPSSSSPPTVEAEQGGVSSHRAESTDRGPGTAHFCPAPAEAAPAQERAQEEEPKVADTERRRPLSNRGSDLSIEAIAAELPSSGDPFSFVDPLILASPRTFSPRLCNTTPTGADAAAWASGDGDDKTSFFSFMNSIESPKDVKRHSLTPESPHHIKRHSLDGKGQYPHEQLLMHPPSPVGISPASARGGPGRKHSLTRALHPSAHQSKLGLRASSSSRGLGMGPGGAQRRADVGHAGHPSPGPASVQGLYYHQHVQSPRGAASASSGHSPRKATSGVLHPVSDKAHEAYEEESKLDDSFLSFLDSSSAPQIV